LILKVQGFKDNYINFAQPFRYAPHDGDITVQAKLKMASEENLLQIDNITL